MALRGTVNNALTGSANNIVIALNSLTGGSGSAPAANDIIVVAVQGGAGGNNKFTFADNGGGSYADIPNCANQNIQSGTNTFGGAYKVATGSETSLTIDYFAANGTTPVSDFMTAMVSVISGRNTSSPFTASQASANNSSDAPTTPYLTAITAAANDDILIFLGNSYYDGSNVPTYTAQSGYADALTAYAAGHQYSPIIGYCDSINNAGGATNTQASGTNCSTVGTTLTVAGSVTGTFLNGMTLIGNGSGVRIVSGGPGGAGTYTLSSGSLGTLTGLSMTWITTAGSMSYSPSNPTGINYVGYIMSLAAGAAPISPVTGSDTLSGQTPQLVQGTVITPPVAKVRHKHRTYSFPHRSPSGLVFA